VVLIAAAFSEVLNSPVGILLVVVFFASFLTLSVTAFGFGTRNENRKAQGLDQD